MKNSLLSELSEKQDINTRQNSSKMVERGQIDTTNIQIHYRSHSCLRTDISITIGGVKLV